MAALLLNVTCILLNCLDTATLFRCTLNKRHYAQYTPFRFVFACYLHTHTPHTHTKQRMEYRVYVQIRSINDRLLFYIHQSQKRNRRLNYKRLWFVVSKTYSIPCLDFYIFCLWSFECYHSLL